MKKILFALLVAIGLLALGENTQAAVETIPQKCEMFYAVSGSTGKTDIGWYKCKGATHYVVYYKKVGDKKWERLAVVKGVKYTHKASKKFPLNVGEKYTYTVRPYNSISKKYGAYDKKGFELKIYPKEPTVKISWNNSGKVTLSFNSKGADCYRIRRKVNNGKWKLIAVVYGQTRYFDNTTKNGNRYEYSVQAVAKGTSSIYSTFATANIKSESVG